VNALDSGLYHEATIGGRKECDISSMQYVIKNSREISKIV